MKNTKFSALIAFSQTRTGVKKKDGAYVPYNDGPNGLKISQLKSNGVSGEAELGLKWLWRTFFVLLTDRPPVSQFDFNCAILRPFGPLVYETYAIEILVALVPV